MKSKFIKFFNLLMVLSFSIGDISLSQHIHAEEQNINSTDAFSIDSEQTTNTSEEIEESGTTDSPSEKKKSTKETLETTEDSEEKKTKIQPFANGDPYDPEWLYMRKSKVVIDFHYPSGVPVENLDVVLEFKMSDGSTPNYDLPLTYNNVTHQYEGLIDYPYQFSNISSTSAASFQGKIRIKKFKLATSVANNGSTSYNQELRRSDSWFDPADVIVTTSTGSLAFSQDADYSWKSSISEGVSLWYTASQLSRLYQYYSTSPYSAVINYNTMSEEFVNEKGERITAPTGFLDYFEYGIINSVENYDFGATGRAYNPGKVPVKYTADGIIYKYEGWYTGWTKPSTLNTTQPISMTIKKNEAYPITVIYSSNVLKTEECFTEDGSSLDSGAHDSSEEVLLDSTFIGDSIKEIIKASNGDYYSYQGWLKDSEVPGTDIPRSGKPNEKMTKDTTFKYIYKKAIPGRSITLTPNVSVIASGDQVTWTAKVKNTSSDPISLDDTELRLDSVPDYVSGSTVVDGLSKGDSFWTGNSIPLIGPGGEVTIEFKTQPVGAPNVIKEIEISAQSTKIAKDIVKGQVRIKDEDSKPVTPGKDFGLENVPSKFTFEDVTVNNFSQVSSLELGAYAPHTVSDGMFVRLFDNRAGAPGWKLTAKLNSFKQTAHPTRTLSNTVTLDFKTSLERVTSPNTLAEAIDPSPSGSLPLIQNNVHLLSDNVDVLVMNGPVGVGDGTWQVRIPLNDVKLILPANNGVAGTTYESDLTWTLTDAP